MMRRAGPFLGERAYLLLRGSAILKPEWGAEVCLFRALRDWNATQGIHGLPVVADIGLLAAALAQSLEKEGFSLSALAEGEALAFDASEIEALMCKIVALESEDCALQLEQQRKIDMGTYVKLGIGAIGSSDRGRPNVANIDSELSESAMNGGGQGAPLDENGEPRLT